MKPVLEGKQETVRDVLYGVYCGGAKPGMRCVKQGDWKLVKYASPRDGVRETQLFNLADNPGEFLQEHHDPKVAELTGAKPTADQRDLAEDPRYADKLAELEALLLDEMRRLDDPYRLWDQPGDGLPVMRFEIEPGAPEVESSILPEPLPAFTSQAGDATFAIHLSVPDDTGSLQFLQSRSVYLSSLVLRVFVAT